MTTETRLSPAIVEALAIADLPEVQWKSDDDLCECVYQRIGFWTNPYLGETLEVRMCCIWAEIYKQYPQFARLVPAYWNYNKNVWVTEPAEWNGETDMPEALWHRQIARREGITVSEARAQGRPAPKGRPKRESIPFVLLIEGEEWTVDLSTWEADGEG